MHAQPSERTTLAMDRTVRFWERRMNEEILAAFNAEGDVTLSAVLTMEGAVSEDYPPLYEDVPKMLRDFEKSITAEHLAGNEGIWDDDLRIPQAWPELQFGNGMPGAIFGAHVLTTSTADHTYTFCDLLITGWPQVQALRFDKDNYWIRKIDDALSYFMKEGRKSFIVRPFPVIDGLDFIVCLRGTTQAFYDLMDDPPGLRELYQVGYEVGAKWFEHKRALVQAHNERVIRHPAFAHKAPIHSVPNLDMDAYALCSPELFESIGLEYKQKILNHFRGGCFYIHALGRHIVPIAARLENLTCLWLFDDPNCPSYFSLRQDMRRMTHDIPLEMYCGFEEFAKALDERTLPGGVKYNIFMGGVKATIADINRIMEKVRSYRTASLAGKPKAVRS